jgi:hypothetical protein
MGQTKNACKILVRKPEGRDHSKDLSVDGDNRRLGSVDCIHLAQEMGPVAGSYENGNELSRSTKGDKFPH